MNKMDEKEINGEALAGLIQEELDKHESELQDEKTRHEERMDELRSVSGLGMLIDIADSVDEMNSERTGLENEIQNTFYRVVQSLCPRQRQSGDEVTVRDNALWFYGRSSKVGLAQFVAEDKYAKDVRKLVDEDNRELFDELVELVRELEPEDSRWPRNFAEVKEARAVKVDDEDGNKKSVFLGVEESTPHRMKVANTESGLWSWGSDSFRLKSEEPSALKQLVRFSDEYRDMLAEVEDRLADRVDTREDILSDIQSKSAKHLVASSI